MFFNLSECLQPQSPPHTSNACYNQWASSTFSFAKGGTDGFELSIDGEYVVDYQCRVGKDRIAWAIDVTGALVPGQQPV